MTMKNILLSSLSIALFSGAALASEPVTIGEGTYNEAIYATEVSTSGGSSLIINGASFNLSSSPLKSGPLSIRRRQRGNNYRWRHPPAIQ